MAKVTTNPITRKQKFLGAIAGDNEAPVPITDTERLLHNIAERVNNGSSSGEQYIVHMTPTSSDGGEMDKSNAEILAAYMQGKRIMFDITVDSAACRVQATLAAAFEGYQYPSFNAYGIDSSGTTIINLYVDPSDEESYSFTMNAVEIGGGDETEFMFVTVANNGTVFYDDTDGNINEQYAAGKKIIVNRRHLAWREGGGGYYTYYCNYAEFLTITNTMTVIQVSFNGTVANEGQGTYTQKEYDLSSLVKQS